MAKTHKQHKWFVGMKTVILEPVEKCNTVEFHSQDFHPRRPESAGAENITNLGSLIFKILCVAFSCAMPVECISQMLGLTST